MLFNFEPNWDKEMMHRISKRLHIPFSKVYKWNWDKKQSIRKSVLREMILKN